jgi:hypothetical protein
VSARAAVAAASAARVLVVDGGLPVRSAAPGVAGRAAREPARDARALVGVIGARVDHRGARRVVDPARRSGDALSLGSVEILSGILDVVGVGAARVTGHLTRAAAAEPEAVDADRGAAEVEVPRDVHREDAAGRAVPGGGRQRRPERRRAVLRDSDDLEGPLPVRAVVRGAHVIRVDESAGVGSRDRQVAAGQADRDRVLVEARAAQRRVAERRARDAAAVGAGVGGVDVGVLHLDDQDEVPRGDRRVAPTRADRDDRRAGGDAGGARVVGVDDAGERSARAVLAGRGAVDRGVDRIGRDEEKGGEVRPHSHGEEDSESSSHDSPAPS